MAEDNKTTIGTYSSRNMAMKVYDGLRRIKDGAVELFEKANIDVGTPMMRRGEFFSLGEIPTTGGSDTERKKERRKRIISMLQLRNLANADPIIWAIRKARRDQVSQVEWKIVRNIDTQETIMDQWHGNLAEKLNPWGFPGFNEDFQADLPQEILAPMQMYVKGIMTANTSPIMKKMQLRWLFQAAKENMRMGVDSRIPSVKYIFDSPCKDYPTWNQFIPVILDDMMVYDAGNIILNKSQKGDKLAEFYTRPGHELKVWKTPEGAVPAIPDTAYSWEHEGREMAKFNDGELVYLMANPQEDSYGCSPVEAVAYVITGTLLADDFNLTSFKYSNVPTGVFDLGANISPTTRKTFAQMWNSEVQQRGGLHKILFISGTEGAEYIPIKPFTPKDMQMLEYLKWSLSVKAACFQISPQDIGFTVDLHRTTSEVQLEISKDRGLKTILRLIQANLTKKIIKDVFNEHELKFEYSEDMKMDEQVQAQLDAQDIQVGAISRNDRRKHLGLPPKEGGDVIIVDSPSGPVPLDALDDIASQTLIQAEQNAFMTQAQGGMEEEASPGEKANNEKKEKPAEKSKPKPEKAEVRAGADKKGVKKIEKVMQRLKEEGLDNTVIKIDLVDTSSTRMKKVLGSDLQKVFKSNSVDFNELRKQYGNYLMETRPEMFYPIEERMREELGPDEMEEVSPFSYGMKQGLLENIGGIDPMSYERAFSPNKKMAEIGVASVLGTTLLLRGGREAVAGAANGLVNVARRTGDTRVAGNVKNAVRSWFSGKGMRLAARR